MNSESLQFGDKKEREQRVGRGTRLQSASIDTDVLHCLSSTRCDGRNSREGALSRQCGTWKDTSTCMHSNSFALCLCCRSPVDAGPLRIRCRSPRRSSVGDTDTERPSTTLINLTNAEQRVF